MVLTMLFFGFFMWGMLLWQRMSPACSSIFDKQFHALYLFHHICTCTNGLFFFLFCLHESFLGKKLGGDFTIMAEVQPRYNTPYRPPMDISPPHGHSSPSTLQTMQTPHLQLVCLHNSHTSTKKLCRAHRVPVCLKRPHKWAALLHQERQQGLSALTSNQNFVKSRKHCHKYWHLFWKSMSYVPESYVHLTHFKKKLFKKEGKAP